jgi:hypothetical protein
MLRKIFGPAQIPARFAAFPVAMALRPSSLRGSAAETALMVPDAVALRQRYRELTMPVVIVAGKDDKLITTGRQSGRLHRELPESRFRSLRAPGT